MSDDSEWARKVAADVKNQRENERIRNEASIISQKRVASGGPTLWADFRSALKSKCASFNAEIGGDLLSFEVTPSSEFMIRCGSATMPGSYDQAENTATIDYRKYSFEYDSVAKVVVFSGSERRMVSADELSSAILSKFIKDHVR